MVFKVNMGIDAFRHRSAKKHLLKLIWGPNKFKSTIRKVKFDNRALIAGDTVKK